MWSCILTSDPDLGRGAGQTWADLGVVTRPQVTISREDIEESRVSVVTDHQPFPRMRLKLNHNYTFICQVQRSFPRPEHRWNVNHTLSNLVKQISLPLMVSKKEYFYNTRFEARYIFLHSISLFRNTFNICIYKQKWIRGILN